MIRLLKILIRLALWIFCNEIYIKNKSLLKEKGALLIIANHPNSFLDAIIIGAQYNRRVFFLARGDVFNNKFNRTVLHFLNMIPVYRLREGKENLHLNEFAFTESIKLLSKGEAVLIFIEGICLNTHILQPFKKGATRILEGAHKINIFPTIHVVGINYNNLRGPGKKINIVITKFFFKNQIVNAKQKVLFNKEVFSILEKSIYPILVQPKHPILFLKNVLFYVGKCFYYIQSPYYFFIKNTVAKKTKNTVFFDSVLFAALLLTYPFYLLLLFTILFLIRIPLPIIFITLVMTPIISKQYRLAQTN